MVHDHLHSLGGGVAPYLLHIKVGIGRNEVEYIVLAFSEPVFPSFVPSFHQYAVDAMLGCKVNVAFHIGRIGGVRMVGLGF